MIELFWLALAVVALIFIWLILRSIFGAVGGAYDAIAANVTAMQAPFQAALSYGSDFAGGVGQAFGEWFSDPVGAWSKGYNYWFGN